VMAPVYEELRKRDNLSANLVSLTFRAQILGMVMPELAQMLSGASMTGAAAQQFHARMEGFNQMLSNQSLALLPKDGSLQSVQWSATGYAELYAQFQMDIAGAAEIPVTRLFGRTISGLGQTNDADERIYEERIAMEQEHGLRPQLDKLYPVLFMSELGEVPDDLELDFPSVRVLTEEEKGKLTVDTVASVTSLLNAGLFNKVQALKEIQQQSAITGFGTAIHDEDISAAEKEESMGLGGLGEMAGGAESESKPSELKAGSGDLGAEPSGEELLSKLAKAADSRPAPVIVKGAKARVVRRYEFAGLPIAVEFPVGVQRVIKNRDGKIVYSAYMVHDYGYIENTFGLDGDEIDVIVGPDEMADSAQVFSMIDLGPDVDQRQCEQKVCIGFPDAEFARDAFLSMYPESFLGGMIEMPVQALIEKLAFHKALTNNDRALALDAEFEESKHPRVKGGENAGQFGKGSGGSSKAAALSAAPADPKQWPEHIKALKLPPAWTDVRINQNPDADLLAVGKDAKGRSQPVYSERFQNTQAEAKFTRIKDLDTQFAGMQEENNGRLRSDDAKVRDNAGCTRLIMAMGIRPGSETDTKAKVKAYGATTLEGRHVVVEDGQVYLRFTGKKGVALNLPVNDPAVAKELQDRARQAGAGGKLYPHASGGSLLEYTHTLDGGGFKTKDFRTLLGTRTAMNQITKVPAPKNEKEYKKRVMEVAKVVSSKLGNTPVVALTSYISPSVFSGWRISANV
jgi:DNA topoisomerase IB